MGKDAVRGLWPAGHLCSACCRLGDALGGQPLGLVTAKAGSGDEGLFLTPLTLEGEWWLILSPCICFSFKSGAVKGKWEAAAPG